MLKKRAVYYWICQMAGWGLLLGVMSLMQPGRVTRSVILVVVGMMVSHWLRWLAIALGWMQLPAGKVWLRMLVGVLMASFVAGSLSRMIVHYLYGYSIGLLLVSAADYLLMLFPWASLYCIVHYAGGPNEAVVRARLLKWRLAEMQKEAETAEVDSDSIIEWLLKIEAMVETNPERSREEITEFSKLLRRGTLRDGLST